MQLKMVGNINWQQLRLLRWFESTYSRNGRRGVLSSEICDCTNSVRKSRRSVISPHPNDLMVKNITLAQYNKV